MWTNPLHRMRHSLAGRSLGNFVLGFATPDLLGQRNSGKSRLR